MGEITILQHKRPTHIDGVAPTAQAVVGNCQARGAAMCEHTQRPGLAVLPTAVAQLRCAVPRRPASFSDAVILSNESNGFFTKKEIGATKVRSI